MPQTAVAGVIPTPRRLSDRSRATYTGPPAREENVVAEAEARVAILMGSQSDWAVMQAAEKALAELGIPSDARVISAHRTPERLTRFLHEAEEGSIEVIIAGAGMSAHLAGVTAAHTLLPVLGVPLAAGELRGFDALLSTVNMPGGIPVATFGIGKAGAKNAALFAAAILARSDAAVHERLGKYREAQAAAVPERPE
jgi:5-(carboxyamino)imidazole ribonucleotide mutase